MKDVDSRGIFCGKKIIKLGIIGMKTYKSFVLEKLYFQNNVLCPVVWRTPCVIRCVLQSKILLCFNKQFHIVLLYETEKNS